MNEVKELVEELRNKKSRDNRDLLDRSADMIEKLAKELCEKSSCHHKCHDTKDCVVEDEALLLINESKSNNFDVKSNNDLRIYGARDTSTGKLVSNITNPRRKYWDRKGNAINAINTYNSRTVKYKHGKIELVTFRLVEVQDE